MFENLADLSFQRSTKQATGFYLVSMLGTSVLTAVILIVYLYATGVHLPQGRDIAGSIQIIQGMEKTTVPLVVLLISTALVLLIMRAKKAYNRAGIICVVLTVLLSAVGALFSLIPVAYLTTLPKKSVS